MVMWKISVSRRLTSGDMGYAREFESPVSASNSRPLVERADKRTVLPVRKSSLMRRSGAAGRCRSSIRGIPMAAPVRRTSPARSADVVAEVERHDEVPGAAVDPAAG